jgi:hypothetical protein
MKREMSKRVLLWQKKEAKKHFKDLAFPPHAPRSKQFTMSTSVTILIPGKPFCSGLLPGRICHFGNL